MERLTPVSIWQCRLDHKPSHEVRGLYWSTDLGKGFCTWRSQQAQWPPSPTHGESLEGSAKEDGRNEGYHSLKSRSLMWCRGTETSAGILNAWSVSDDSLEKTSKSAFRANFEGSEQHAGGCSEQVGAKGPHFIYIWYQDQVLVLIPFVVPLHHRHYTVKDPDAEAQCYKKHEIWHSEWV